MRRSSLLTVACLLLGACANDIRVTADWDPATTNLAARKTFAFGPEKECGVITPGRSIELRSPLYRERVNRALLGGLLASGRAEARPEKAELVVTWSAGSTTVEETDTISYRDPPWYNDTWRIRHYETRTWRHEEQTLTVTLRDAQGKAAWTGSVAAPELADASPEDREKRIRELVRRLLLKLPSPVPAPTK